MKTPCVPISPINSQQPSASSFANQFREYHDVREKTLADNPGFAAEYKSLLSQIAVQEDALNAAMIQADTKDEPIVAKLVALRKQNEAERAAPVHPLPAPSHS